MGGFYYMPHYHCLHASLSSRFAVFTLRCLHAALSSRFAVFTLRCLYASLSSRFAVLGSGLKDSPKGVKTTKC